MKTLQVLLVTLRSGQFWRLLPHYFYRWLRGWQIELTPPSRVAALDACSTLEVFLLCGRRQHVNLLYAAKSFLRHYGVSVAITVFGDPSMDEATIARLKRHLPGVRVLTKAQRDERLNPELARRGLLRCAAFRQAHILAAKVVDAALLSTTAKFLLLDTDCLSLRPLTRLRELVDGIGNRPAFSQDPHDDPYTLPTPILEAGLNSPVAPRLNSGVLLADRTLVDLDRVEQWLETALFPPTHFHAEQTLWAALIGAAGKYDFLPEPDYDTGRKHGEKLSAMIHYCGHYLGPVRLAMQVEGQKMVLTQLRGKEA